MSRDDPEINKDLGILQAQMVAMQEDFRDHLEREERAFDRIYERLDEIHKQLSEMHGARKIIVWMFATIAGGLAVLKGWFDLKS